MKRARIILSSLAILAVVGTALAFKAKDRHQIFCQDVAGPTGKCTVPVSGITTQNTQDPILGSPCNVNPSKYGAVSTTTNCPTTTVQFYNIAD